jgi:hypothetical protein
METILNKKLLQFAALFFVIACEKSGISDDLAYSGSVDEVIDLIDDNQFGNFNIYTIVSDSRSVKIDRLQSETPGRELNVYWSFEASDCKYLNNERGVEGGLVIVQGNSGPIEDVLIGKYLAYLESGDVIGECGEQIEYINYSQSYRLYRERN